MDWTFDRIEALAPDAPTLRRAQALAFVGRWKSTGRHEHLVFGAVRGSGAQPYRTIIDTRLSEFSCTCRSRKRPCKHALGLSMIHANRPESIPVETQPQWVTDWVDGRTARLQARADRQAKRNAPVDPETAARRAEGAKRRAVEREQRVHQGVDDLARWIRDIARQGVAAQTEHSYRFWDEMASRMIDAQAPGLAKMVRSLGGVPHSGEGWASRFLENLARIHLVVEAYRRIDELEPGIAEEVRVRIGFKQSKDKLKVRPGVEDQWWVTGQRVEESEDGTLSTQRTWLWGDRTKRPALLLDFQVGQAAHDRSFRPGTCVFTELVFYDGSWPVRALAKREPQIVTRDVDDLESACTTIAESLHGHSSIVARLPWATQTPARLRDVVVVRAEERWAVRDAHHEVNIVDDTIDPWPLLAISGGRPITIFGEWIRGELVPHAAIADGSYVPLLSRRVHTW